ncbi:MAG: hypothetical protein JST10_16435 [Bacteroidetes bacterium]|nr:hypothetical protein [Bacteroidota bacterium]MBS1634151.1 hypothetical protein [Bacteroidota bacterium]
MESERYATYLGITRVAIAGTFIIVSEGCYADQGDNKENTIILIFFLIPLPGKGLSINLYSNNNK